MKVVSREGWGALPPLKRPVPRPGPARQLVVHHAAAAGTGPDTVRQYQRLHMAKFGRDIGYQLLVEWTPEGGAVAYEGCGLGNIGTHVANANTWSMGLCLLYDGSRKPAPPELLDAAADAAVLLYDRGHLEPAAPLVGHRDVVRTACPGAKVYDQLADLEARIAYRRRPAPTNHPLEDDMPPKPDWLPAPIVASAMHPAGGYYLVDSAGGVFTFGGAPFYGSLGGQALAYPITSIAVDPGGNGYLLVASDGGVFAKGEVVYKGSMPDDHADGTLDGRMASGAGG